MKLKTILSDTLIKTFVIVVIMIAAAVKLIVRIFSFFDFQKRHKKIAH